jgi:hypothetical protein
MLANNETGVVQDVAALAAQAKSARAWFHTDAVQAFGKRRIDFRALNAAGVHALTLSAHKLGGPKGAGALVVDKRVELQPLIAGGGHERGLRSGTENVAAIVGFGLAAELATAQLDTRAGSLRHCARSSKRAWWRRGQRFSPAPRNACRTPATSPSPASTAKPWSASWTAPVLPWLPAPPVPAPIPNRRGCCWRWVFHPHWRAAPCGSVLVSTMAWRRFAIFWPR